MRGWLANLRTGCWLTRERIRLVAAATLIASVAGLVFLLVTANGLIDTQGRPLGTDFSNVYAAGSYALEGKAAAAFDPALQHARERAIFGEATPFYGWHYPPFFLFVAAALATMPYLLALFVWQAATLILYVVAIKCILSASREDAMLSEQPDRLWLLLALAYPAVFVNLGHGHNGFLTAALMAFGLVQLDRRPWLSGMMFGLLAYKPQFGLMIPLVLMASGRWRAFGAASLTIVALAVLVTLAFGADVWPAFIDSLRFTRDVVLETGNTGWFKIQSVFSWVRMWGGSIALAYALQTGVTLALAAMLIALWRGAVPFAVKAAGLCVAAILATPYSLDYDLMMLAPALAYLAAHGVMQGFTPYEKSALALLWITPLIARSIAQIAFIPLGVLSMLVMLALIVRRAELDLSPRRWLSPLRS